MELKGKVALVTGAARGIGRAIAIALADAGCDVAVSDIGRSRDGATPYALASDADVERMLAGVERAFGGLDVLIANAGIIAVAPVVTMDEAQWDRIFAVNVKGVFLCARAAIPLVGLRGGGR